MADGPSVLRGLNLSRSFGEGDLRTQALKDVSFDMEPGQIALLMGPSGSGKSTLLAILSGLLQPDSGSVLAWEDGRYLDLWKMSDKQRERFRLRSCGFIFQGYNLLPALSARQQLELILLWGEGASRREARKRADEMLDLLGLAKKADRKPAELSGGEKQRVAIGRALIKNPRFCFADEPTSALDWENGEKVVELLRLAAHERDASILLVSHDNRIQPYVDVEYLMEDGRMIDTGEKSPLPKILPVPMPVPDWSYHRFGSEG